MEKIVLIGGGGHCNVVIDALIGQWLNRVAIDVIAKGKSEYR